jgi:hypothetical protein
MVEKLWDVGTWVAYRRDGVVSMVKSHTVVGGENGMDLQEYGYDYTAEWCPFKIGFIEIPPEPDKDALKEQGFELTGMAADCSGNNHGHTYHSDACPDVLHGHHPATLLYYNGWRWLVKRIASDKKDEGRRMKDNHEQEYEFRGKKFKFNDHVYGEMLLCDESKRSGLLVQVRIGCGQFGSDVYFVRLRDGTLQTWENVMLRHVKDEKFVDAFYRYNSVEPPNVPPQPPEGIDTGKDSYSRNGLYPEVGFLVEKPEDPQTPGSFTMTITKATEKEDG